MEEDEEIVWVEPSPIISENAEYLLELEDEDDSARRSVEVRIIPLDWAKQNNTSWRSTLFELFERKKDEL